MQATESSLTEGDLALREACRDSLTTFAESFGRNYRAARVHRYLARQLEQCASRNIRRICISCPPRTGKSLLTSIMFPAWVLTRTPESNIIQASYASELSESFSRSTKAVLSSDGYRSLFPPILDPSAQRQKSWRTLAGGNYFATGVGGGATGRGADIFIADDLVKNRDEASSATHREKVWDWFMSTAMTRLAPDGVMIVIATRWHEDDLIGRLTNPERVRQFRDAGLGGESFAVVRLEAICNNPASDPLKRSLGDALWPEQWPVDRLEAARIQIGPHEFAAQYQQRPSPPGGNLCDIEKIRLIDREAVPDEVRLFRAWDLALTTKVLSDYSCGAFGGMDKAGNVYLVNMSRGKKTWNDQKRLILQHAEQEAIGSKIGLETVGAFKVAYEELKVALAGRVSVTGYTPDRDKVGRATPWLAKIDASNFCMVRGPWNRDFLHELEQFPNGAHDDQVDAVSVLWDMIRKRQQLLFA